MEKKEEPTVVPVTPGVDAPYVPTPVITVPELAAVVLIVSVVIIAAVLKPDQTGTYLGFGGAIIASVLAMSKAQRNSEQTRALRLEVNHRLTQLLEARQAESRAAGRDEERDKSEAALIEQKADLRADRAQVKADIREDQEDAAPVEVVNLPPVQKVEIVEPKKK